MLKMLLKQKNQMDHGGWIYLTLWCNLIKLLLIKFSRKIGKFIQFKVNGLVRLMAEVILYLILECPTNLVSDKVNVTMG